jgi:2-polyprenyl-3-methyl-5-hydroxy-6-metoxy-1,4-benzoquinol methylase
MPLYDHSLTYREKKLKNIPHIIRLKQIMKIVATFKIKEQYLDIGCSNGFVTNKIVSENGLSDATGFDHNRDHLKIASEKYPNITFSFLDLNVVNTIEKKFKLVTCFEVLEHVGNLENALTNLII